MTAESTLSDDFILWTKAHLFWRLIFPAFMTEKLSQGAALVHMVKKR
jgi:hypothetical protein